MSESSPFPRYRMAVLSDGHLFIRSRGRMVVPQGGGSQRQLEFRIPRLADDAVVTATVVPADSNGPSFVVYSVKIDQIRIGRRGSETQIVVSAQSVTGMPVRGRRRKLGAAEIKAMPVDCSIMVTGTAVDGPAGRTRSKRRTR